MTYSTTYIPKRLIHLVTSDNSKRVFSINSALDGSVVSQLTTEKKITNICQHFANNKVIKATDHSDFSGKQHLKKTCQTNRGYTEATHSVKKLLYTGTRNSYKILEQVTLGTTEGIKNNLMVNLIPQSNS